MPSIQSIKFDTTDWTLEQEASDVIKWTNDKNQFLSLHYFAKKPDIPCAIDDIDALRTAYRLGLTNSGGALISADYLSAGEMDCVKLVFKTPRQRHGMVYVGSLTFPFADFSYVIKVQCAEFGVSGMRDAIVMDKLMSQGVVSLDPETKAISGWSGDPYDPSFKAKLLCHKSDDESYDAEFPDHPLSLMRRHIAAILATVVADPALLKSARFSGADGHSLSGNGHKDAGGHTANAGAEKGAQSQAEAGSDQLAEQAAERKGKPWWKVW